MYLWYFGQDLQSGITNEGRLGADIHISTDMTRGRTLLAAELFTSFTALGRYYQKIKVMVFSCTPDGVSECFDECIALEKFPCGAEKQGKYSIS